jgi:hypothetical protein
MNRSYRRTRLRLLAGVSGAVTLSLLAVAGCSSSSSSSSSSSAPHHVLVRRRVKLVVGVLRVTS